MVSKSVNIPNILKGIESNEIPGSFNEDLTVFSFPVITYKNKNKEELNWSITIKLIKNDNYIPIKKQYINLPVYQLSEHYIAEITVISFIKNGKVRKTEPTYVTSGKNIGKKNETNVITQAFKDAYSIYLNKFRKTNTKDLDNKPLPMAIQTPISSKSSSINDELFEEGVILQRKINGVRYVTYLTDDNKIIQYSRSSADYSPNNLLYEELMIILTNLPKFTLKKYGINNEKELNVYQNVKCKPYLDGELYLHGKSLPYISGQARKKSEDKDLKYYIFDVFFPYAKSKGFDMISLHRQEYLTDLFKINKNLENLIRVENFNISSLKELNDLTKKFIKDGYEGSVLRKNNKGYEYSFNNYHSPNAIKIKPVFSDEFKIVGFTQGSKGKALGKIIWICEVNKPIDLDNKLFNVVPNMTDEQRGKLYSCLIKNPKLFKQYIKDQLLTVEYSELSNDTNKPLQAKGIIIRTYENEYDPIKKVYDYCNIN